MQNHCSFVRSFLSVLVFEGARCKGRHQKTENPSFRQIQEKEKQNPPNFWQNPPKFHKILFIKETHSLQNLMLKMNYSTQYTGTGAVKQLVPLFLQTLPYMRIFFKSNILLLSTSTPLPTGAGVSIAFPSCQTFFWADADKGACKMLSAIRNLCRLILLLLPPPGNWTACGNGEKFG